MNKSVLKRSVAIHREEICIFNCNECDHICDNKRNAINLAIKHFLDKTFTLKNMIIELFSGLVLMTLL